MLASLAERLIKRVADDPQEIQHLPPWAILIFLIDFIAFVPLVIWMLYTLTSVYPALAMVEDENPPAYDPVPLTDDGAVDDVAAAAAARVTDGKPRTATSSIRSIERLMYANGGWRASFRGFFCLAAQSIATWFLFSIFQRFMPTLLGRTIATLLVGLSLIQLSTAWVHIVISPRSHLHFWQRLPPFKKTFDATAGAVVLYWAATMVSTWLPAGVAMAFGLHFNSGNDSRVINNNSVLGFILTSVVGILCQIFILIPAEVILVRVQASLLPVDVDTIIPFDRSFEGKVEPAVVGGKGYVTITDAWKTFSGGAWRRLVILYVKIAAVMAAVLCLMAIVIIPEIFIIAKYTTTEKVGGK